MKKKKKLYNFVYLLLRGILIQLINEVVQSYFIDGINQVKSYNEDCLNCSKYIKIFVSIIEQWFTKKV